MLLENLKDYKIILASESPRRQFLLKELGLNFELVVNPRFDETYPKKLVKDQIPVYLAEHKANAVFGKVKNKTLVIAADTIVWCGNKVLNKPADHKEAVKILTILSGKKHQVITGVCIKSSEKRISFYSSTDVFFKDLTEKEIIYYVNNYKPYDKAGAYGIQEWIGYIGIKKINGSYFNVVGLPVQKLYSELINF